MKLLGKLWLAVLVLAVPIGLLAQGGGEQISSFDSQISVSHENVATISETIDYDFGILDRHGIRRFVPARTNAGETGKFYYYNFKFISATQDGNKVEVQLSREGDWQVMRLGDPDRTISGVHRYVINYQMSPVVERDVQGDFFNWNLTGNYWEVPIATASAVVSFEQGVEVLDGRCYSGAVGSTAQDCQVAASANKASFNSQSIISPGEGLTANLLLTPNSFSTYLAPQDPPPPDWRPIFGFIVGFGSVLFGALRRFWAWAKHRYQLKQQIVVPQYESPDGLKPAEIGLLNDNRANMAEITATLIDLAVRGYIKIEQTQAKGLLRKPKYTFHKLKEYADAEDFEKDLLDMIFSGGENTVKLEEISATKASSTIQSVKAKLKKRLQKLDYYAKREKRNWPSLLRPRLLLLLAVIALNLAAIRVAPELAIFSMASAFISTIFGWLLTLRTQLSQTGYKQWAEVEGLKTFLTFTEKDRLKFHNAPDKNPKQFHQFLPYAVALGVERQWAKQFAGMDVSKESGWYSSPTGNFYPIAFASSLSSDFSKAVSSNFTPTQSSGGFSGGGSSGGGGGGGGGGSW